MLRGAAGRIVLGHGQEDLPTARRGNAEVPGHRGAPGCWTGGPAWGGRRVRYHVQCARRLGGGEAWSPAVADDNPVGCRSGPAGRPRPTDLRHGAGAGRPLTCSHDRGGGGVSRRTAADRRRRPGAVARSGARTSWQHATRRSPSSRPRTACWSSRDRRAGRPAGRGLPGSWNRAARSSGWGFTRSDCGQPAVARPDRAAPTPRPLSLRPPLPLASPCSVRRMPARRPGCSSSVAAAARRRSRPAAGRGETGWGAGRWYWPGWTPGGLSSADGSACHGGRRSRPPRQRATAFDVAAALGPAIPRRCEPPSTIRDLPADELLASCAALDLLARGPWLSRPPRPPCTTRGRRSASGYLAASWAWGIP